MKGKLSPAMRAIFDHYKVELEVKGHHLHAMELEEAVEIPITILATRKRSPTRTMAINEDQIGGNHFQVMDHPTMVEEEETLPAMIRRRRSGRSVSTRRGRNNVTLMENRLHLDSKVPEEMKQLAPTTIMRTFPGSIGMSSFRRLGMSLQGRRRKTW